MRAELFSGTWGLGKARQIAARFLEHTNRSQARSALLKYLLAHDVNPETRKRAANVARRISDRDTSVLAPAAAHFAAALADTPPGENRTRWHLGLVVARSARTESEVSTAAELMWLLAEDKSNVARCSAVEGLGLLALHNAGLRAQAEPFLHQALRTGTAAVRCRARHAIRKLQSHTG